MATVGTLVSSGPNHLRYLVTSSDTTALTITSTGAASPDLLTDTARKGPLNKMAKAFTNGYGTVVAGALTQAQSRAIWNDDGTVSIGGTNVPRAQCSIVPRTGATVALVDCNVDGGGHPTIVVTPGGAASFYLEIDVFGAIGA